DRTLVTIDTATATVTRTVEAQGVGRLLGIDLRPGNRTVIGVSDDMRIVVIDPASGATRDLSRLSMPLPAAAAPVVVEVNAVPDRLRLMTGTTNYRVNMDTGEVAVDGDLHFDAADAHAGRAPAVAATAYLNAHGKPETTAMYNIDTALPALLRQTRPNDGTNVTLAMLALPAGAAAAFDIGTTAGGVNTAWLAAGGMLYTIDLETGGTTGSWALSGLPGALRDLTIIAAE
ncbi:MAG: DUF4394 domain-containing protein, partial [Gemmobacter sp.]